jgi:hypothetical protein
MLRAFGLYALCTAIMRVEGLAFQKALFADGMMCAHFLTRLIRARAVLTARFRSARSIFRGHLILSAFEDVHGADFSTQALSATNSQPSCPACPLILLPQNFGWACLALLHAHVLQPAAW